MPVKRHHERHAWRNPRMADAKETMRYLTKEYEIAPAGTREESDAATIVARVFHQHGLETMQKSFNYTWHGNLGLAALMCLTAVLSIVGVLLSGVVSTRQVSTFSRNSPHTSSSVSSR